MGSEGGGKDRFHTLKKRIAENLPGSLAERWEQKTRERTLQKYKFTELNELLTYHLEQDYPGELAIHVNETFTKTPREMQRLTVSGLKELAHRIETDDSLAHLTHIVGFSWIVNENPKLAEMLGFVVTEHNDKEGTALAKITREDFLKRFGTKTG